MKISLFLSFDGNCAKAFELYKRVFGGNFLSRATLGDSPMKDQIPPERHDRVMYVAYNINPSFTLLGRDLDAHTENDEFIVGNNTKILIHTDTKEEADRIYQELSEGGRTDSPISTTSWGAYNGALTDSFGVKWMIEYNKDCRSPLS